MGEGADGHYRKRDICCRPLAAALRITADLEGSAIRRELRPEGADMASCAGLAGLLREGRHCARRSGSGKQA